MFKNPVYDMMVVVPALLIAGLIAFFVMTGAAHAQEPLATSTGSRAETASTSGTTLPDRSEKKIVVTRAQLETVATSTPIASALIIHTNKELLQYARQVLADDPYIASITLSAEEIVVTYRKEGRLLGVLPVSIPRTAHVHTDGTVSFDEPWYGTVTIGERDYMKTALEVRVHALLTTEGYLSSMSLAPATQAEILDIIRELIA
jgi:hypothetical protein